MPDKLMRKFLVPAGKPLSLKSIPTDDTLGWDKDSAKGELAKTIALMAFEQHRLMAEAKQYGEPESVPFDDDEDQGV